MDKRTTNRKWDLAHYEQVTFRVPKATMALFRELTLTNGDSQNGIIRKAIDDYIAAHKPVETEEE